jgi:hypothetical protein
MHFNRQKCRDADWNKRDEISTEEIAWCIFENDIQHGYGGSCLENLRDKRRQSKVIKEIAKLTKKTIPQDKQSNIASNQIEMLLTCNGSLQAPLLSTKLFKTPEEVVFTFFLIVHTFTEIDKIISKEKIGIKTDTKHHTRDYDAMLVQLNKCRLDYLKLGGDIKLFDEFINSLKRPDEPTVNEFVNKLKKSNYIVYLKALGVKKMRAEKIANEVAKVMIMHFNGERLPKCITDKAFEHAISAQKQTGVFNLSTENISK